MLLVILKVGRAGALATKEMNYSPHLFYLGFIEFNVNKSNTAVSILMSPYYLVTGTSLKYALMSLAS